jgi:hypothetical protein
MLAAEKNRLKVVEFLVKARADREKQDKVSNGGQNICNFDARMCVRLLLLG